MTNDIPYKHTESGRMRMLPEGTGELIGYERLESFTPPELQEVSQTDQPLEGYPLKDAIDSIEVRLQDDADFTEEDHTHMDRLVKLLTEEYGLEVVDHSGFKDSPDGLDKIGAAGPSILSVIQTIEAKIDTDTKISAPSRVAIKKILDEILIAPAETSLVDSIPPTQPGKTGEESANNPNNQ